MAKRSSTQNRYFHGRLGDWSAGIKAAYKEKYSKDALKLLAKALAEVSGDPDFADLVRAGTRSLDSAAMDKLVNITEEWFSRKWPDAYIPARFDGSWGEGK